jgi:hypothetical protein
MFPFEAKIHLSVHPTSWGQQEGCWACASNCYPIFARVRYIVLFSYCNDSRSSFEAQIVPLGNNLFTYSFTGKGLDLSPGSKVKVGLTIGINTGTTHVRVSS